MSERIYFVGLDETSWNLILSFLRTVTKHPDEDISYVYSGILKEIEGQICSDDDEEDLISAPPD